MRPGPRRLVTPFTVLSLLLAVPPAARGQQPDSATRRTETVAPGIAHISLARAAGPWRVQVVTVDLRRAGYHLLVRHAGGAGHGLLGRERTSAMAGRLTAAGDTVLAAINGDFFDLASGENENNQVVDGELLKGVPASDSPWDTFRNPHTQLAVGRDGRVYIDRFAFAGTVRARGARARSRELRLDGVNVVPRRGDALVLFTAARGGAPRTLLARAPGQAPRDPDAPGGPPPRARAPADSAPPPPPRELRLRALPGGSALAPRYRIEGGVSPVGADSIAPGSARLVAYGRAIPRLDSVAALRAPLELRLGLLPARGALAQVIGGWGRLLADGRNLGGRADSLEGTFPSFSARRHARSAIGLSRDSTTLFLVAVDGPKRAPAAARADSAQGTLSAGMTLQELGELMLSLGAWQAMNLDGGGSTTLIAAGRVVNAPSDPDGERAVGNALFVVKRRR